MRTVMVAVVIGAAVFGAVFLFTMRPGGQGPQASPGGAPAAAAPGYVQRDQGEGAVEVEVIFVTPEYLRAAGNDGQRYEPDKYSVFIVSMNTHSVDLSGYDMAEVSELRAGGKTYTALGWISTSDNSHHRSGVLRFPRVDAGQAVELVIKTVAGIPARIFRWAP